MRALKITGSGLHGDTQVLDAETGESLSARYGIFAAELKVGADGCSNGLPMLVLSLNCPVEVALTGVDLTGELGPAQGC